MRLAEDLSFESGERPEESEQSDCGSVSASAARSEEPPGGAPGAGGDAERRGAEGLKDVLFEKSVHVYTAGVLLCIVYSLCHAFR